MKKILSLLLLLLGSLPLFAQTRYYVKPTGNDDNNGTSWATAFRTVQKALTTMTSGEIWVAAGTYYPDETGRTNSNDRNASFSLKNNVALYGGFAGSETDAGERRPAANPTILSGEIQGDRSIDNNAYHVVRSANVNATAVLDGFTITGGRANNQWGAPDGGIGAGMYNYYASPTISNCLFTANYASPSGGGMQNDYSSPTLTNCSFVGNKAYYDAVDYWEGWGAAMDNYESAPVLLQCSFARNEAAASNGATIDNSLSSLTLVNCVLWDNGKEIYGIASSAAVSYSLVRGGYPGTGNRDGDPLFVDAARGNLRLQGCSPAIDAGRLAALPSALTSDADGNPRWVGAEVDMGAYEYQPGGAPTYLFVNSTVDGGLHDGTSWANAFDNIPDALQKAATCHGTEIWVTTGTYYPTDSSTDRTASFLLQNNTTLRGGFIGTETPGTPYISSPRLTTLSGDIDRDGTLAGNAYHVVQAIDVTNSAVLDGFIITGGMADAELNLVNDRGAGVYNERSYPTINRCIITGNRARNYGGGLYNGNSDQPPLLTNCLFTHDSSDYMGGAIFNLAASPLILQCTVADNYAADRGGGVCNYSSSKPVITNSILWNNGQAIANALGGAPVVSYSLVEGGWTGTGNLAADPLFVLHGYSLMAASPAINAGSDAAAASLSTDLEGQPRKQGLHVDMGAYEFASTGGPGSSGPLTLTCPGGYMLQSDADACGAIADFTGAHGATTSGGKAPVTLTYVPASGSLLPVGENTITVTATDGEGSTKTCSFIVPVVDVTPPVITGVSVDKPVLYPPNHKLQEVNVNYEASDNCDPPGALTTILTVSSNEPVYGSGSGATGPDWEVVNNHQVRLRAERSGKGTDRVYTLTITAKDATGNMSTATTTVTVPHDKGAPLTAAEALTSKEVAALSVTAAPNPSSDGFTLQVQSPSILPVTIRVIDTRGRVIEQKEGIAAKGTLYLGSSYRPGVYYLQVEQGGVRKTIKLIKQTR